MSPRRAAGLLLALLACVGTRTLQSQELSPLTAADQARVEELLQGFDPASYDLRTQVRNPDGSIQTRSVGQARGLASLQQLETTRPAGADVARTNHTINIFSQAKTNHTINIFREAAGTNHTINIFRDAEQQQRATEINSILQRYVSAPPTQAQVAAPSTRLRSAGMARREMAPASGTGLRPLSATDQARVEKLLQSFDPNSYELNTQVAAPDGSVQMRTVGQARGLASLQQLETARPGAAEVARTNHTINIFSQAKTNHTINIFREAAATNTTINIFKDETQQRNAAEINSILQQYLSAP